MRSRILSRCWPAAFVAALAIAPRSAFADSGNPAAPTPAGVLPAGAEVTRAPDFAFASTPYGWRHLHDLCARGPVLLVFGANDAALAELERQHARWTALSIEPLAVRTASDGDNWKTIEKLHLTYGLLSDATGSVAGQFGLAPSGQGQACARCLVDERLRVLRVAPGAPAPQDLDGFASLLSSSGAVATTRDENR